MRRADCMKHRKCVNLPAELSSKLFASLSELYVVVGRCRKNVIRFSHAKRGRNKSKIYDVFLKQSQIETNQSSKVKFVKKLLYSEPFVKFIWQIATFSNSHFGLPRYLIRRFEMLKSGGCDKNPYFLSQLWVWAREFTSFISETFYSLLKRHPQYRLKAI